MFILALGFARPSQAAIHCVGKSSGVVAIEHSFEIPESSRMNVFDLDQSAVYLTHKKNSIRWKCLCRPLNKELIRKE